MQVIKDNQIITDDWTWLETVEEGEALPEGDIIIPFRYWKENRDTLGQRSGLLAVCIDGDDEVADLAPDLDSFPLVALAFPAFKDGRCYSHARLLRDRYQYQGDLRAVGDVLRDQLFYMQRCGISSYSIRSDKDIEDALKGLKDYSISYQDASDRQPLVYQRRN